MLDKSQKFGISKFAASNFQFNIDQSLINSFLGSQKSRKPFLGNELEMPIKDNSEIKPTNLKTNTPISIFHTRSIISNMDSLSSTSTPMPLSSIQSEAFMPGLNEKKEKMKKKEMIELKCLDNDENTSEKALEKIEKLREMKILTTESKKKRDAYFKNNSRVNVSLTTYDPQLQSANTEKDRKNGLKKNILGSQKKIDKYEKPNHCHFIEMEVEVLPTASPLQVERKMDCKSIICDDIMARLQEKICCESSSSQSIYESFVQSSNKPSTRKKRENSFEKKLQNFIIRTNNRKLQLSIEELQQFKDIIYRKNEAEYFKLYEECNEVSKNENFYEQTEEILSEENLLTLPSSENCKVHISNIKRYDDLIERKKLKGKLQRNDSLIAIKGSVKKKMGVSFENKTNYQAGEELNKYSVNFFNKMEHQHKLIKHGGIC